MTVTVTAETLTDEQIRALRNECLHDCDGRRFDVITACHDALSKGQAPGRLSRHAARSRIAAILNAREEKQP